MTYKELMALIAAGKELPEGTNAEEIITAHFKREAAGGTDDAAALKAKNKELLDKLAKAKETAASLPEGFDKEKWKALVKAEKEAEEKKLKDEQQWEKLQQQLVDAHAKDEEKLKEQVGLLKGTLQKQLVQNQLRSAIASEKGNTDLLLPHLLPRMKMVEKDGIFSAIVVDSSGEPAYSKEKAGEPMTAQELVNEYKAKETFAAAFMAVNGGGGASGSGGGVFTGKNPFVKGDSWNLTEQAKLQNTNPSLAKQMQAAAAEK